MHVLHYTSRRDGVILPPVPLIIALAIPTPTPVSPSVTPAETPQGGPTLATATSLATHSIIISTTKSLVLRSLIRARVARTHPHLPATYVLRTSVLDLSSSHSTLAQYDARAKNRNTGTLVPDSKIYRRRRAGAKEP